MSSDKARDLSILMPPPPMEGGLIKMPKKNPETDDHKFLVPNLMGWYNCWCIK